MGYGSTIHPNGFLVEDVYERCSVDKYTGKISLRGHISGFPQVDVYYGLVESYGVGSSSVIQLNEICEINERSHSLKVIRAVQSTPEYSKGSTSYGDVASSGSGTYPTNSYSGNYWYVYKGSDTIDPTAVSYDASTVIAGETVSVTISPSSGNSYGGTITYSVEVNVDETGWEPYTETTSTSFTFTIPEDAVSWRCRVKARDNLGFT